MSAIAGKTYPVENWSFGGVLITSDDRVFADGQDLPLTLKFKLRNTILDVNLNSRIVRKGNHIASPCASTNVGRAILRSFQQVDRRRHRARVREFAGLVSRKLRVKRSTSR